MLQKEKLTNRLLSIFRSTRLRIFLPRSALAVFTLAWTFPLFNLFALSNPSLYFYLVQSLFVVILFAKAQVSRFYSFLWS